jgi:hypothetical protein
MPPLRDPGPRLPALPRFLGDLFDGAALHITSGASHAAHRDRFQSIFGAIRAPSTSSPPQLFASGNHDIGFREMRTAQAARRHTALFGPTSHVTELCGHDLVVVDAVALAFEDTDPVQVGEGGEEENKDSKKAERYPASDPMDGPSLTR